MKKKSSKILLYFLIVIALAEFILSSFYKYNVNNLSLSEFVIVYPGNLISIILSLLLLSGVVIHLFSAEINTDSFKYTFIIISAAVILPYPLIYLLPQLKFNLFGNYILGFPAQKLILGLFLFISKSALLYLIGLFWLPVFYNKILLRTRSLLFTAGIISLLLVFSFLYSLHYKTNSIVEQKNNLGIVFGAAVWSGNKPSPLFKGRIEKAYKLLKNSQIVNIQVTGGNAPGELSEAKTAMNHLVEKGVKEDFIIFEDQTSSTSEQINYIYKHRQEFIQKYNGIILISDSFHLPRIMEICKFFKIKATPISSDYKLKLEKLLYYRFRESIALLIFWIFGI
ncbi:MAG: hypothetical protein CVV23_11065 [Ignavibacteriae bacterium HGW-Ignavibacteriae-2]|jgi:vancomycin permeability regulator SanA|nr:MAG: hypothetical protein CVV23_11065 [Ignavibacteriae bacterium HGW-Ignavibacteriae-2]